MTADAGSNLGSSSMNTHYRFSNPKADKIQALNDAFRTSFDGGTVVVTSGVAALGADLQSEILKLVQSYDAFDSDNDPYGEHDFGMVTVQGHEIMFKIDYYDHENEVHSPDASDPSVTKRVMTIMLSEDY
jgi:hypothetical protein